MTDAYHLSTLQDPFCGIGTVRKGTPNKVTTEAKAVCAAILDDPTYRTNLTARARAGTLAPAVEVML